MPKPRQWRRLRWWLWSHYCRLALALSFLSRLPLLPGSRYRPRWFAQTAAYFPLAGLLMALVLMPVAAVAHWLWGPGMAALLLIVASGWLSGYFHEDGLADSWDALAGYASREHALVIMKDSRVGTYGSAALWASLTLRWQLLLLGPWWWLWPLAQATSRLTPLLVMHWLDRAADPGQHKPSADRPRVSDLCLATATVLLLLWLKPLWLLAALFILPSLAWLWARWLRQRLGGWTGDTLGAVQQLSEVALLAAWVLL